MTRGFRLLAGLVGVVLVAGLVSAGDNGRDRPMVIRSDIQNTLSLLDYSWDTVEAGVCTHGGAFTSTGAGWSTPAGFFGSGEIVVANGDKLYWGVEGGSVNGTTVGTIYITGGTGRFAKAVGMLPCSYTPEMSFIYDPNTGYPVAIVFTASYVATGTIRY